MSLRDYLGKSNVQTVLAIFVTVFCFYSLTFIKLENDVKLFYCTCIGAVMGFYFGSSRSSQLKDLKDK